MVISKHFTSRCWTNSGRSTREQQPNRQKMRQNLRHLTKQAHVHLPNQHGREKTGFSWHATWIFRNSENAGEKSIPKKAANLHMVSAPEEIFLCSKPLSQRFWKENKKQEIDWIVSRESIQRSKGLHDVWVSVATTLGDFVAYSLAFHPEIRCFHLCFHPRVKP